ncbi:c-type cytochrome [Flavisolibacter ginsenosidimutans]|uniref:Cytochrome c n=1 Tax=Flavisolibacter ginsenosidimutans TaxID=661481 RepID=A0A5B8UMP3_9BACT|nr:cytochrome c [Flavisolibacter ginsenosidimutans]QEC57848.1 cytochrome c [Flavisolibacter ginsenosidimutans]
MSQIKYLVSAFLLLLLLVLVYFVVDKLSSTEIIAKEPTVINVDTPAKPSFAINAERKSLFYENCATCHALDKVMTGPALRGINERGPWIERKNLVKWVRNPAAMIPKLAYTRELAATFNGQVMPSFSQLTDKQIEDILDYIKTAPTVVPTALPDFVAN